MGFPLHAENNENKSPKLSLVPQQYDSTDRGK